MSLTANIPQMSVAQPFSTSNRLNLTINPNHKIEGYNNMVVRSWGEVYQTLKQVPDGYYKEISINNNLLSYFSMNEIQPIFQFLSMKLEHEGELYLHALDLDQVCHNITYATDSIENFNLEIFISGIKAMYSLMTIEPVLNRFKLNTVTKGYDGKNFYIRSTKV